MYKQNYFNKTHGIKTLKDKFEYIKNHETYWTMNSWNRLYSIANNIKAYNLGFSNAQQDKLYGFIECENFYQDINFMIENSGLNVGVNGRSGGYLVLYNDKNNCCAIDDCYCNFENYKEFLEHEKAYVEFRIAQENCRCIVERDFELVKQFDELCDEIRNYVMYLIDNAKIEEKERILTQKYTEIVQKVGA